MNVINIMNFEIIKEINCSSLIYAIYNFPKKKYLLLEVKEKKLKFIIVKIINVYKQLMMLMII